MPAQNGPARGGTDLIAAVRACTLCDGLPLGPKPLLQWHPRARILIAGQAPGKRAHEKGVPFDDPSGDRLRAWMGIGRDVFYDASRIAILPMGFCFPGKGAGGDLPPRAECAPAWRQRLLDHLSDLALILVIGQYALRWHVGGDASLTDTVRQWRRHWPRLLPLPHPSPRNGPWLKKNPWFAADVLPALQARVRDILGQCS
ncbi:MAG: uracil-DNA glycosylase family protein [Alphaproteobacteria bacterium]|nr:MAG: uracil-DNA glycosylase family protein [Alphaproteobacteria bacterium]